MDRFVFQSLGKFLVIFGAIFILLGIIFLAGGKIPYLGRLPGDIHIKKDNISFHFPIVTSIVISIILTIVINLIWRK